MGGHEHGMRH